IQVDPDNSASIKRFQQLAAAVDTPLIAAAYDPPLALVRSLVRAGATDVISLPLTIDELESALEPVRDEIARRQGTRHEANGKLVTVIKSVGGVGATALLSQLAIRFAERESASGNESCIIDLDVQFGDIAFQLGMQSKLTLFDLLEAGNRLDADMLRATTSRHPSGLNLLSAPPDMMPMEGMPSEQLLQIVELATHEFGVVFVDLPTNWTNWSLSLAARSDIIFLVTELSIAGLHRARRQLDLLRSQDLGALDVRVIVNRFEKSQARKIGTKDVRDALGRDVSYYISNDFSLMHSAIDRGVPIEALKRKSSLARDLDAIITDIAISLSSER
ncbi:MAG: AAA family ATPase, partial [Sphingomicrobium sp.]